MPMKQAGEPDARQLHQPNGLAWATVAILTAAPPALYLLGTVMWGEGRLQAALLSKGHWPLIALAAFYVGVWLYTADETLRSYRVDEGGLTVYRPFLADVRVQWSEVGQMRRGRDRILLSRKSGWPVVVRIDCVHGAEALAGAIVDNTHRL